MTSARKRFVYCIHMIYILIIIIIFTIRYKIHIACMTILHLINNYNGITILSNGQTCECMPKWAEYAFIINLSISVIL